MNILKYKNKLIIEIIYNVMNILNFNNNLNIIFEVELMKLNYKLYFILL